VTDIVHQAGPLASALSDFSQKQDLPLGPIQMMRLSLIDWVSVAMAGSDEPVATAVKKLALSEGGAPSSSLIGQSVKTPPRMAAMVNGTIGHALDYDDTHFAHIGHPSAVILPAALAIAQSTGATGEALQEAALIGVEASIRVGIWLGRDHYQTGFHQTATAGAFGAGIACARLLGFSKEQTLDVVGLLATRVSGLKSQFGSMGKPFNAGLAASNAVEAALLVQHGLQPNRNGLEAVQGFGETHHGQGQLEDALNGLGDTWLFETISHKFHACCHGLHATLEAFRPMQGRHAEIAAISVSTNPRWLRVCNIPTPRDGLECKFSYRHVLAMAAFGQDTASIDAFTEASANDGVLKAFREKVSVSGDDTVSETAIRLSVELQNGEAHELFHDLDAPIDFADRKARILAKSASLIGQDSAEVLQQLIFTQADPDTLGYFLSKK
jgi:2-methylcitrate dehydratase PrpD